MKENVSSIHGTFCLGKWYDVSDEVGKDFVNAKYAEDVKDEAKKETKANFKVVTSKITPETK
jgi:hypothetical protein